MIWALFGAACVPVSLPVDPNPLTCDPRALGAGEVRVRRIPCSDELFADGDGRRGDWLLENDFVRAVIRDQSGALSRVDTAGGTLVDLDFGGGPDLLTEVVPEIGDAWLIDGAVQAGEADGIAWLQVTGTLPDGTQGEVLWSLAAGARQLEISGADRLVLVPTAGAALEGDLVEPWPDEALAPVLAFDGAAQDWGGWISFDGATRLVGGAREEVAQALWPEGRRISGEGDADWVEAWAGGQLRLRLPFSDGAVAGTVPIEVDALIARREGADDGEPVAPDEGLQLNAGAEGWLQVRVVDEAGTDLRGYAVVDGEERLLAEGGAILPVGAGLHSVLVGAGPRWELTQPGSLDASDLTPVEAVLRRAIDGEDLLAGIGIRSWPDRVERRTSAEILEGGLGRGLDLVVLTADDAVATASPEPHVAQAQRSEGGSRAATPFGAPLAWPWSANSGKTGWSAASWEKQSGPDLLAMMARGGARITAVDTAWAAAAGEPMGWDPLPELLSIADPEELPTYLGLLDRWLPVGLAGPLTWIEGVDRAAWSTVDAEASILEGRTIASNGPSLRLRVDGSGPGSLLLSPKAHLVTVQVQAPSWMTLDQVSLIGRGGEILRQWALGPGSGIRLQARLHLQATGYLLAMCSGAEPSPTPLEEPAWAITSPIWLGRP